MKELVSTIKNLCLRNPNTIFYEWNGAEPQADYALCRYDQMSLSLAYMYKGTPCYRHVPLCQIKNLDNEPIVCATTESLVRVISGPREKRVVRQKDLFPNERSQVAGVFKHYDIGSSELQFRSTSVTEADIRAESDLRDLVNLGVEPADTFKVPALYITCPVADPKRIIKPRKVSKYYRKQHNLIPFDVDKSDVYKVNAGKDRVGYDFADVYGRGVVAGDMKVCGHWYSITPDPKEDVVDSAFCWAADDITVHIDL